MATAPAKHILIVPLDWGLGHTTRCIPLIQYLLQQGHGVTVAGNALQHKILNAACPGIIMLLLPGYEVKYSRSRKGFLWSILRQLPRLLRTVRREHQWLLNVTATQQVDGIISDNRYGLHHPELPAAIMTHQLEVRTGMGNFFDRLLRPLHYRYLQRFGQCWVVDVAGTPNLAGSLSHPPVLPAQTRYIGWLSHLQQPQAGPAGDYLLVVLSGPEPQRTILADRLWRQALLHQQQQIVFVEGNAAAGEREQQAAHIQWHAHLPGAALQPLLAGASMVICRSGYSTLMDLVLLGKKAILIPTPGQTEQEYLGRYLCDQGIFYSADQEGFRLEAALAAARDFPFKKLEAAGGHAQFIPVLEEWLMRL